MVSQLVFVLQKLVQRDSTQPSEGADKEESSPCPLEPYRRMMPGMKLEKETDVSTEEQTHKDQDEGEGEEPALPTPRKRLMNFKIPLVKGSQRRDQQQSVVARRRLFGEEQGGYLELEGVTLCRIDQYGDHTGTSIETKNEAISSRLVVEVLRLC